MKNFVSKGKEIILPPNHTSCQKHVPNFLSQHRNVLNTLLVLKAAARGCEAEWLTVEPCASRMDLENGKGVGSAMTF